MAIDGTTTNNCENDGVTASDTIGVLAEKLRASVSKGKLVTESHLSIIERDVLVDGAKAKVHLFSPQLDGNNRISPDRLVEYLFSRIVDYAIPKKKIDAAFANYEATGSSSEILKLEREARKLFTNLKNSGEGGELLLFALAEGVFKLTHLLCKMSLKTNKKMHYNGADGVYATIGDGNWLDIWWGESKLYQNPTTAITDCLKSLAPFLRDEHSSDSAAARDIYLINDQANIEHPEALAILKSFLDPDDANSKKMRMCGFAMVGFDSSVLPANGQSAVWQEIEEALKNSLPNWSKHIGKRLGIEKIIDFEMHFIMVPFRSVAAFRKALLDELGL